MIVNTEMQAVLDELATIEGNIVSRLMCLAVNDMGNKLIELYYRREHSRTRELIRDFLSQAGVVWLRKLLTNDTRPVASSRGVFAGLDEYLDLLAANDDAELLVSNY